MTTLEIILIVLGAIVFVASFVVPETKSELEEVDKQLTKEQIQEMLKEEMKQVQQQVSDVIDETVTYSVEKSERAIERMTNEKIQAISEYSGTVLTDIHKNHEETMFLYDMLNDKHENLKTVASEVSKAVKEAGDTVSQVRAEKRKAEEMVEKSRTADESMPQTEKPETETVMDAFEPITVSGIERVSGAQALGASGGKSETGLGGSSQEIPEDAAPEKAASFAGKAQTVKSTAPKGTAKRSTVKKPETAQTVVSSKKRQVHSTQDVDISFYADGQTGDSKEKILKLHEEGKSNVAIAKELGLGIGEVNLIITLYKGM